MTIRKDKLLIIDIEATCWEGYTVPAGQYNEIIEIGACLLDLNDLTTSDARAILVKPMESDISPFCTQLTALSPELIAAEGVSFEEACHILEKEYDSRNRMWASWGNYDREIFKKQCKRRKVRYPFSGRHANLKRVYADVQGQRAGLQRAFESLGLDWIGRAHRGVDDAANTARLMAHLLDTHGLTPLRRRGL